MYYQFRADRCAREEPDENTGQNDHVTDVRPGGDHHRRGIAAGETVVMQHEYDDGQSLWKKKKYVI